MIYYKAISFIPLHPSSSCLSPPPYDPSTSPPPLPLRAPTLSPSPPPTETRPQVLTRKQVQQYLRLIIIQKYTSIKKR